MKDTRLLNYIGLANLIYNNKQPKYVYLILNTLDNEKVKYKFDDSCYLINNEEEESVNYKYYLRDCLLDNQNFERCIEIIEETEGFSGIKYFKNGVESASCRYKDLAKPIEKFEINYARDIEEKIFYEESDKPNYCILDDVGTELLINKINEIIDKLNKLEEGKK